MMNGTGFRAIFFISDHEEAYYFKAMG